MPLVAGPETFDTTSTVPGACTYPAQALGVFQPGAALFYAGAPLKFAHAALPPTPVPGVPNPPLLTCAPGVRVSVNKVNKSVFFNSFPPLVQGDLCQALGTERPLVGPFTYPNLFVANSGK
jgi:hypothetical protein